METCPACGSEVIFLTDIQEGVEVCPECGQIRVIYVEIQD